MTEIQNVSEVIFQVISADGSRREETLCLLSEFELTVQNENGFLFQITCTGTALKELVYGRLFTDGLIGKVSDVEALEFSEDYHKVSLRLNSQNADAKELEIQRIFPEIKIPWDSVFSLANEFLVETKLHQQTQAVHCCILAIDGKSVWKAEDVSRHNCLDKVIGYVLLNGIDPSRCMLYTSGRTPRDMVQKVVKIGIPILVSKSVPTKEAVVLANSVHLTLINRAWPDRAYLSN